MKKKYIAVLLGCAVLSLAAGCGKDQEAEQNDAKQQATTAVTGQVTAEADENLVNMVKLEETPTPAEKTMGVRIATSATVTFVNKTGKTITNFYVRPFSSDYSSTEWGNDLIGDEFAIENGEEADYYYEPGDAVLQNTYDVRIVYNNEVGTDENYFRNLPLESIGEIALNLNGEQVPYATYYDNDLKTQVSTLQEVLVRMGLAQEEDDLLTPTPEPEQTSDEDADEMTETTDPSLVTPTPEGAGQEGAAPTSVPQVSPSNPYEEIENQQTVREIAQGYIGQSIDNLLADPNVGEANDVSYGTDPDMGEGGYYYYDSFTVFTSVDEQGNETVTQIW